MDWDIKSELQELKERMFSLEEHLKGIAQSLENLGGGLGGFASTFKKIDSELQNLKLQNTLEVQNLKEELVEVREEVYEVKEEVKLVKADLTSVKESVLQQQENVSDINEKLTTLEAENEALRKQNALLEKRVKALEADLENYVHRFNILITNQTTEIERKLRQELERKFAEELNKKFKHFAELTAKYFAENLARKNIKSTDAFISLLKDSFERAYSELSR